MVGLLVNGVHSLTENGSELADLLQRKSLRFIHITSFGDKTLVPIFKFFIASSIRHIENTDVINDDNIICVTANRFDAAHEYESILVVGDISGKKFNPLQSYSAKNIDVFIRSAPALYKFIDIQNI